ncbi:MAG: head decoration protein [Gammaproteobacteria bacterium]|uniref:Putative head decoration protein n=1 Tax=viral metagenome TaxID=1070528 RepID=A0A6M3JAL9_9ZZZZ|nr:head decoration protein [Gammaproteobacteria bacterium]MBU1492228.1 head decoration protein [Gammaproteobacteria bacterium]MBU2066799.1 head decoration protein [Gammaproteobacteria bacterium]MBU2137385.1 head decoration protein [Gammaproteobacteria bacterium]MBU2215054.1 head decoration protein [Gammaproteobacteria bacterium]
MTIKTEGVYTGEFLLSEANGTRSREEVVIAAGSGVLAAGTLIAQITAANALTPTADAGNTGNGTIGSVTVTSAAITGAYIVTITEAAANGGAFEVVDPTGAVVGQGTVGQPFTGGGLTFTLGDGSTDFAEGDGFSLALLANLGEYTAYDDDGTDDGRRAASGILYASVDATLNDVRAVGVVRDAEVIERLLTGLDAAGRTDLLSKGIVIRP